MKLIKCQNKDSETNKRCLKIIIEKVPARINGKAVCQNCYESIIWRNHKK